MAGTLVLGSPSPGASAVKPQLDCSKPRELSRWGLEMIDVEKAAPLRLTLNEITVAVIDTGLDFSHPDFEGRLWTNAGESGKDRKGREKASNGIDDDRNGFVDDVHGWNFAGRNNDLRDRHGHGTHIAGIIAGRRQGISPNAKLMILKFYDPAADPKNALTNTVDAIAYATKMGAHIINFSAGGGDRSPREEEAIRKASKKNILFIAAAGNEKADSDIRPYFPAGYDIENILSVGALTWSSDRLSVGNFGRRTVDLAAPGGHICSTSPGGGYEPMSGTSQATAFATGVAVLLLGRAFMTPAETIRQLSRSGLPNSHLKNRTKYEVQLNSYRALAMKDERFSAGGL
ncbi:MAG TPA: S8 family peptidase, partial [Bdellovibrionales bacterium]|nr:S8 family peptidase [Bdellovibrionales bacterium]